MICQHVKPDGSRGQARALTDKALCFFHDPDSTMKRKAARRRGGSNHVGKPKLAIITLPADCPDFPLRNTEDVVVLLGRTINDVMRGKLSIGVGHCLSQLASVLLGGQSRPHRE